MSAIRFPKICAKYIKLQCNNAFSDYVECPELQPLLPILTELNPKRVLELGAGIGRGSVYLQNNLPQVDAEFFLVDGDAGDTQVAGIHHELKPDYYNSFDAAYAYCTANGISHDRLHLVDASKIELGDRMFDLCISIKAIGFHWPISGYLNSISKHMRTGSLLCFEVRNPDLYAESRHDRLEQHVSAQKDSVDLTQFKIISHVTATKFHMLILAKT